MRLGHHLLDERWRSAVVAVGGGHDCRGGELIGQASALMSKGGVVRWSQLLDLTETSGSGGGGGSSASRRIGWILYQSGEAASRGDE